MIGIGTRYSDFTTASHTLFADPGVRFLNINVARFDAVKHAGLAMVADARTALEALTAELADWQVSPEHRARTGARTRDWDAAVDAAHRLGHTPKPAQSEVVGAVNEAAGEDGVVICAAGSLPGDLHRLWRPADPKQYHVEYGYSCMGYEIAGGLGVKLAAPEREVFVMVGDGSYLMMAQELVTAVAEGVKLIVVLVQNHGFASIGALSETVGAPRFGTWYRYRDADSGALEGGPLPVDLAANAASLGADVLRVASIARLREALAEARASDRCTVIHIETDPLVPGPSSGAWWDVPVAEVSDAPETGAAREAYVNAKSAQRPYL